MPGILETRCRAFFLLIGHHHAPLIDRVASPVGRFACRVAWSHRHLESPREGLNGRDALTGWRERRSTRSLFPLSVISPVSPDAPRNEMLFPSPGNQFLNFGISCSDVPEMLPGRQRSVLRLNPPPVARAGGHRGIVGELGRRIGRWRGR